MSTDGRRAWLAGLSLGGLALLLRALPYPLVLVDGRVLLASLDGWYRLRRIHFDAHHLPDTLGFDPYLGFPDGAAAIWPHLFDLAVALPVRWLTDATPGAVERVAIWAPPVLGALAVLCTFRAILRPFGLVGATVAALLLALAPVAIWYSQISFVDHHVAAALWTAVLLGATLGLLSRWESARPSRAAALGVGVVAGLGLLTWPGFLLHVAVLELFALAGLAVAQEREGAQRASSDLALAAATAGVLVVPFAWGRSWPQLASPDFTPVALSSFHAWFFALLVAFHALCFAAWHGRAGRGRGTRIASATALGLGLLALSLPLLSPLVGGAGDALGWLAKSEVAIANNAEATSILRFGGSPHARLGPALAFASGLFLVAPLLVPVGAWLARTRSERLAIALLGTWTLLWGLATLSQARLANSWVVGSAALTGAVVALGLREARARGFGRRARVAGVVALVAACVAPSLGNLRELLEPIGHRLRDERVPVTGLRRRTQLAVETAEWLRAHTPETSGFDGRGSPEYGILSDTDFGHLQLWVARRPQLVGAFANYAGRENFELSRALPALGEAEAFARLRDRRIRYLVIRDDGPQRPGGLLESLRLGLPLAVRADAVPSPTRHRLIHESAAMRPWEPRAVPAFRVFERVEGAVISGPAPPGATVLAELRLRAARRPAVWRVRPTRAADGRYALRVPYATTTAQGSVASVGGVEISCQGRRHEIDVDERAVRAGLRIPGPDCGRAAED